jgi:hypothetical protein
MTSTSGLWLPAPPATTRPFYVPFTVAAQGESIAAAAFVGCFLIFYAEPDGSNQQYCWVPEVATRHYWRQLRYSSRRRTPGH